MIWIVITVGSIVSVGITGIAYCIFSDVKENKQMREEDNQVNRDRKIETGLKTNGYEIFCIDGFDSDFEDKEAFLKLQNIPYQIATYNHSMICRMGSSYKYSDPRDSLWVRNLAVIEETYKIYKKQLNKIRRNEIHQQALKLLNN